MFVGTLVFVRFVSLFRRISWRKGLNGEFPAACGSWAASNGCTRVVLEESGCTRAQNIPNDYTIVFSTQGVDRLLNTQISQCVQELKGAKLMSPRDLDDLNTSGNLIHITFNSAIFGFIDDMYMQTEPLAGAALAQGEESSDREVKMQSQLRIGSYDFDQNYDHVQQMVKCLDDAFDDTSRKPLPCSISVPSTIF